MTVSPMCSKPFAFSSTFMSSALTPRKGVPSPVSPVFAHTSPSADDRICPMVMRDGNAWGLITKSAAKPSAVKGMSHCRRWAPHTPFWPCSDVSLSPGFRNRTVCICTATMSLSSRPLHRVTESTVVAWSRTFSMMDWSRRMVVRFTHPISFTSMVLPMKASPPINRVPGGTKPCSFSFS